MTWFLSHSTKGLWLDKQWKLLESLSTSPFHTYSSLWKKKKGPFHSSKGDKNEPRSRSTSKSEKNPTTTRSGVKGTEPLKEMPQKGKKGDFKTVQLADFMKKTNIAMEKENEKKKKMLEKKRQAESMKIFSKITSTEDADKNPKKKKK